MGLFDTIHLDPPLACPVCGVPASDLQTHEFGETMTTYRIGSVIAMCPVLTGILRERLWCATCHGKSGRTDAAEIPVYVIIWHSVLAGVTLDAESAERRLAAVDRLDLLGWLDEAQRKADQWQQRFQDLRHDVRRWHEHLHRPPPEAQSKREKALRQLWDLPEEILNAPDPLAVILERSESPGERS